MEISTSCNASCVYCPRTVLRSEWVSRFMDLKLYSHVIKELLSMGSVRYVHLQGWGEPLLHPNLSSIINEVRNKVNFGLTTNGMLLNEHYARMLLESGIDVIAVTFAGAFPSTHNAIRRGCDFNILINNVRGLIKIKEMLKSDSRVIASYIMMSVNIHELPDFIELVSNLGIEEVVLDNLSYILNKGMIILRAFSDPIERKFKVYERIINLALKRARELGIKLFTYSLNCWELTECPERPTETIFININGHVSPCVFLNLPTRSNHIPRCFMGKCFKMEKIIFGNLNNNKIINIWNDKAYREFRFRFIRRHQSLTSINEFNIDLMPPDPCITCYRLYGI
ncbi:radical SAM/SPASM domain-containing protein [Vulcanisaeta thermophila]|uniref:radical SAM/SPASM domain-containing protein n=1 Tax=Vulcanisaeta thermophila TaxID=867917 RepID=UPI000AA2E3B7|nr:radical SAM/SPASM domain-containing protein [Vulcanisaeta thermophila]